MTAPKKKPAETITQKLDSLFEEGDPLLAVAMASVGIASALGARPPFTRLLMASSNASSSDVDKILTVAASYAGGLGPGLFTTGWFFGKASSGNLMSGEKEAVCAFFLGMGETYLIAQLFRNPEFFKALGGAMTQGLGVLKGVAGAV